MHELRYRDAKGFRKLGKCQDRYVVVATFHTANVTSIHLSKQGQVLLRNTLRKTHLANRLPKR